MPADYQSYLAAQVLTENRIVNYRVLSRALKIHVNTAKEQLHDFYRTQNARKPSTVHATYLLTGIRNVPAPQTNGINGSTEHEAEDTIMSDPVLASSPPLQPSQEYMTETIPTTSITLCREEDLKSVQASYSDLHSIHVYSLEAGPLQNLNTLSECNLRLAADNASDDPLKTWETYGTIHNPRAQRRTTRAPPPAKVAPPAASASAAKADVKKSVEVEPSRPSSQDSGTGKAVVAASAKKPPTMKRESSSLFKSFQKAANQPRRPTKDQPMADAPDEGSDSEALPQPSAADAQAKAEASRKDKAEREAKLAAMMDQESEAEASAGDEDEEMLDAEPAEEPEPEPEAMPEPAHAQEEKEANVTSSDGRRRGRRRIMKKKTTKDADGYLVTREEPAWESFSEDDVPKKAPVPVSAKKIETDEPAAKKAKPSGAPAKKGQGNIMNFFGKR